jgi:hypothetical protein
MWYCVSPCRLGGPGKTPGLIGAPVSGDAGATFQELGTATQRVVGSFRICLGLN